MQEIRVQKFEVTSAHVFTAAFVSACALAALLIGSAPLQMSIATIFLFAGVHNFMEFRYFAARMPLRWGRSRGFYSIAIGGVVVLAAAYISIYFAGGGWLWSPETSDVLSASWNTAFILWIAVLFYVRGRQTQRGERSWAFAAAFGLCALAWAFPQYWSLSLVYIHPLVAMWFLERQIRRTKPEWLRAYHYCLAAVPVFVAALWLGLAAEPSLPSSDALSWRITQHAGSEILVGISSRFLVATHVFLESTHYFVWILLIPLIDRRAVPWKLSSIPLFAKSSGWPKLVTAALAISLMIVAILWGGFAVDYTTTRDVYFAFAIGHVLAEFPFLIKTI